MDLTRTRAEKARYHKVRAKRLFPLLVFANFVFALGAGMGVVIGEFGGFLLFATGLYWIPSKVRRARAGHLLREAAFTQPFAEEVLPEARRRGGFVLFLRAFDPERRMTRYEGADTEFGAPEAEMAARPIEALLVALASREVPILTLTDPQTIEPLQGAYRFAGVPEPWDAFVLNLIREARLVVLYLSSISPGILTEIGLLLQAAAKDKTIVIVHRRLIAPAPVAEAVRATLATFPYVVREDDTCSDSRTAERRLRAKFLGCVRALSATDVAGRPLLANTDSGIPLFTPSFSEQIRRFLQGPVLRAGMFVMIFPFLQSGITVYLDISTDKTWSEFPGLLYLWFVLIVFFTFPKPLHLAYLVGSSSGMRTGESSSLIARLFGTGHRPTRI
jgi:hypothetical protein